MEFLKFNQAYKEKLEQVIKEKKLTDLFEQVDEALKRVKDLMEINREHQMINGKLRSELEIERKNHTLTREGLELEVRMKDKELGRMMKKLQN